jgi:hypothetical protein
MAPLPSEVHSALASLLLREGEYIPRSNPVIREQTYQLSSTSFFRAAGLHPDRTASGRFYTPPLSQIVALVLDPSFSSEARGSGFTTSISLARLASPEVFRVITISQTYSWEVLARCGPPPAPAVPRAPCAAHLDAPLAEGRASPDPPARIDYAINEAPNLLRPRISPCLAEVHENFRENGITPDHMLSDAGLDYADGLPHLVFSAAKMPVDN